MKLETLKTIESALNDAIMAERAKAEVAKEKLEIALRDALKEPEIGRGNEVECAAHLPTEETPC